MWVSASPLFRSQPGDFPIRRRICPSFMNRMLSALLVVILCIMGAISLYQPWTSIWEKNYFLSQYPSLMRILLHPAFRAQIPGAVFLQPDRTIRYGGADPAPAAASRV